MKKILSILLILLLFTSCSNNQKKESKVDDKVIDKEAKIQEVEENYVDNNPIKLGLYLYTNSQTNRKLLKEYTTDWNEGIDLCSLEVYYTTENEIPGTNQKEIWNNYYTNYQNIDNYKIGYKIEFTTNKNTTISKYILSPSDTNEIFDYIQIYLYDDINQTSGWYDHVSQDEYYNSTILTSIKLTGSYNTELITSDIILTAFTYDDDDFDKNGNYRGNSKFSITIKRS